MACSDVGARSSRRHVDNLSVHHCDLYQPVIDSTESHVVLYIRTTLWSRPVDRVLANFSDACNIAGHWRCRVDKNRIEGAKHQIKGAVKEVAGKVTGDKAQEVAGKMEKNAGKVQKEVGKAADHVRSEADKKHH